MSLLKRFLGMASLMIMMAPFVVVSQTLPPEPPIGGPSLALAREAVETAIATCKAGGQFVSVVVLDADGATKISEADDQAMRGTPSVARRKALTSLTFKMDGIPLADAIKADKDMADKIATNPADLFARPSGARLIKIGERVVGVIGVSGSIKREGAIANDDMCAQAGLQKITGTDRR